MRVLRNQHHPKSCSPLHHDPLEKDEVIHVDRDDQRFGCGMAVRLETEDPVPLRKGDASEFREIGDVVCGCYIAAYLDAAVVPLPQSFLIEVQRLLCAVGCDIRGKADFQTAPGFARFSPGLEFFRLNAGSGKEKRSIQIRPHRASHEVGELQISPGGLESMSFERCPRLKEFLNHLAVRVLESDPLRFKARPSLRRAKGPVRNLLVAKVDSDRHVIEDSGFALRTPQHSTLDQVSRKRGETVPTFESTVRFDRQHREGRCCKFRCLVGAFHLYVP